MTDRENLIAALSSDLAPVKPIGRPEPWALVWLLASAAYVVAVIHAMGPIRPEAMEQLATSSRFVVEMLVGLAAIALVSIAAFRASVPGLSSRATAIAGGVLMCLWIAGFIAGLENPALEPSMSGKRHYCFVETFIYALPPVLLAFLLLRRFYPMSVVGIAGSISLAAGMLPALYMQIACMYIPAHILAFHVLPGFAVAAAGGAVALVVVRRRSRDNT